MEAVHRTIAELARRQHGLVTRAQAMAAGLSRDQIAHLLQRGRWVNVARRVYRINGTPLSWKGRMMAVVLAAGPDAVISHRSAAALWGLQGFDPPTVIDVTVPRNRQPEVKARLHRARDYELVDRTVRDGIPVTGLARTVLDLCAVSRNPQIPLRALDAVRRRPHRLPWSDLRRCLVLHARRGRRGVTLFRSLLERRNGAEPPDGELARLVLDLLVDAGLPAPECEYEVVTGGRRYHLDLAYGPEKIDMECDGKDTHLNEEAFEADPVRDNALELDGWLILHFTWQRLQRDPAGIVAEVRQALMKRRSG